MPMPVYRFSTSLTLNGLDRTVYCEAASNYDAYAIFEAIYGIKPNRGVFRV